MTLRPMTRLGSGPLAAAVGRRVVYPGSIWLVRRQLQASLRTGGKVIRARPCTFFP